MLMLVFSVKHCSFNYSLTQRSHGCRHLLLFYVGLMGRHINSPNSNFLISSFFLFFFKQKVVATFLTVQIETKKQDAKLQNLKNMLVLQRQQYSQ